MDKSNESSHSQLTKSLKIDKKETDLLNDPNSSQGFDPNKTEEIFIEE
jgi:hypothetical protein